MGNKPGWDSYVNEIVKIEMNNDITEIGAYIFNDFDSLIEIVVSNSLQLISDSSFSQCPLLVRIDDGNGVRYLQDNLGNNLFCFKAESNSLSRKYRLFSKARVINNGVFSSFSYFENIILTREIKCVESYAFSNCDNLNIVKSLASNPPKLLYTGSYPFPNTVSIFIVYNDCLDSYINDAAAWQSYGEEKFEGIERPIFPVIWVEAKAIIPKVMIITLLVTITVVAFRKDRRTVKIVK